MEGGWVKEIPFAADKSGEFFLVSFPSGPSPKRSSGGGKTKGDKRGSQTEWLVHNPADRSRPFMRAP